MSDKYLDPATNPFIPTEEKASDDGGKAFDPEDFRVPVFPEAAKPADLEKRLSEVADEGTDIVISGYCLEKMADNSWTYRGRPLAEAPRDVLSNIAEVLKK